MSTPGPERQQAVFFVAERGLTALRALAILKHTDWSVCFDHDEVSNMLTKSEHTIANILSAAGSLFVTRNYADVTMDQIAEASHVTKGALYHHFASKEDLYLGLMHTDLADKREMFREAISTPGSCRERLRRLTAVFFALPAESREITKLVRRDINVFSDPARAELVKAYQASLPELIERVIRDGIRDGEVAPADPRLLSWYFVALVEVTLSRYADSLYSDADAKLNHVMDLFFKGAAGSRQEVSE
jgi:AcrR family transcriptional regulator